MALAAVAAWALLPEAPVSGALMVLAGALSFVRLARWQGARTFAEPLVWSLHIGFIWIPAGLVMTGLGALWTAVPPSAGLHALTAGAMGAMTLAVMTRATRGHTGRELAADALTTAIYALIFIAALTRVAAPFEASLYFPLLTLSAVFWCAAFGLFVLHYGRMLAAPEGARK